MIVEVPDDNSIVKWKINDNDGWKVAEISDLINAYMGRLCGEWIVREDLDYLDENKVIHKHFQCNKCGFIHDFIDGHTSQYNFCPYYGVDLNQTDPIISAIQENNAKYDERPNIDFRRISYDLGGDVK